MYLNPPSPQGRTVAPQGPSAILSPITSPPRLTCARRFGTTHSRQALSTGTVGCACRNGLSLPRTTPMWLWPASLPALPHPGKSPTFSWLSLYSCHSYLKSPFSFPHSYAPPPPHPQLWVRPAIEVFFLGSFLKWSSAGQGFGGMLRLQELLPSHEHSVLGPLHSSGLLSVPGRQPGAGRVNTTCSLLPLRLAGDGEL